jgi:hypothetical protein
MYLIPYTIYHIPYTMQIPWPPRPRAISSPAAKWCMIGGRGVMTGRQRTADYVLSIYRRYSPSIRGGRECLGCMDHHEIYRLHSNRTSRSYRALAKRISGVGWARQLPAAGCCQQKEMSEVWNLFDLLLDTWHRRMSGPSSALLLCSVPIA